MYISIVSIVSGVLLIFLLIFLVILFFYDKFTESSIVLTFMIIAILGAFNLGMGIVSLLDYKEVIQPIEVYRGNTELRIETREINGELVSCDTVVVRKK